MCDRISLAPATSLASMTVDELAGELKPLWEDARLLAMALCGRQFTTWESLIDKVEREFSSAADEWRQEVLRAHPRLGEDPEGLKARSLVSWSEQGGARSSDPQTAVRLTELNQAYEARFGFPFVEWVAGRPLAEMADVIAQRLRNDRSEELDRGCAALVAIARDRLRRIETGGLQPS